MSSHWTTYTPDPPTSERRSIRELVREENAIARQASRRIQEDRERARRLATPAHREPKRSSDSAA